MQKQWLSAFAPCGFCIFVIWVTLFCLVCICDTIYIQLCFLSTLTSTIVTPGLCSGLEVVQIYTHRPEVVNISWFLTGTTRIKFSVDELPSPAMGRSTFPRATAFNRGRHRSFSGSVSASQPKWRLSFPSPALWKGIFMVPRTMPASWQVVPGETLCIRLALSPAQSCWLLILQDLTEGFSMSSKTSASKSLECVWPWHLAD